MCEGRCLEKVGTWVLCVARSKQFWEGNRFFQAVPALTLTQSKRKNKNQGTRAAIVCFKLDLQTHLVLYMQQVSLADPSTCNSIKQYSRGTASTLEGTAKV